MPPSKCTCCTQRYDAASQSDADLRTVAEYLRRLADEYEGRLIKSISLHVTYPAKRS